MSRPFVVLLRDYQWIHLGLGVLGNTTFVVGSVFFLFDSLKNAGTWLFIIGSAGMLVGSLGSVVVKLTEEHYQAFKRNSKSAG